MSTPVCGNSEGLFLVRPPPIIHPGKNHPLQLEGEMPQLRSGRRDGGLLRIPHAAPRAFE